MATGYSTTLRNAQLDAITCAMPKCEYRDYLSEVVGEAERLKAGA